jgi:hypothetical protein
MRLLAALLVLVPCFALSQSPGPESISPQPQPALAAPAAPVAPAAPTAAPPAAPAEPIGSIGAGLSLYGGVQAITLMSDRRSPMLVAPSASVERRLSGRSWLALGVAGSASRYRQEIAPGGYGFTSENAGQLTVSAGLRRLLTPIGAPVDFSILTDVHAGFAAAQQTFASGGEERDGSSRGWLAGVGLGVALDRELTRNLSLRVATPLIRAGWEGSRIEVDGEPTRDGSSLSAAFALDPRLELRMAF